jgi:hypothetical protein
MPLVGQSAMAGHRNIRSVEKPILHHLFRSPSLTPAQKEPSVTKIMSNPGYTLFQPLPLAVKIMIVRLCIICLAYGALARVRK